MFFNTKNDTTIPIEERDVIIVENLKKKKTLFHLFAHFAIPSTEDDGKFMECPTVAFGLLLKVFCGRVLSKLVEGHPIFGILILNKVLLFQLFTIIYVINI